MLDGHMIRDILASLVAPEISIRILSELDKGRVYEAERLLLSQVPDDQWPLAHEVIASIVRTQVRQGAAS